MKTLFNGLFIVGFVLLMAYAFGKYVRELPVNSFREVERLLSSPHHR